MANKTKLWYLENFKLVNTLSKDEFIEFDKNATMRSAPKSSVLYFPEDQSNTIYILKEGKVKISKISPDGKEIILAFLYPGEMFGELGITGQDKREEIAVADEDCVMCIINTNDVKDMMASNPKFNFSITKLIGLKFKKIQNRFEALIFKNSEQRIASFILELSTEYGMEIKGNPEEKLIRLKITHDEISKLTATSRQTVTSALNKFQKEEVLIYDRKSIFIKNLSKLKNLA